ncbi:ATP-dependent endonuclease [Virgibacillus soli]
MRWWFNFRVPYTESFINELNEDITFILIPIDRDNKEVIWNENSLLKLLLSEHFEKSTSRRDNLTPKVKRVASELERVGLIKIQEAIEKKYTLNKDFKFVFNFDSQIDYSLLLDQINIEINEKGLKYNITESGSGIQSLTIIAMYRYLAELRHKNIMLGIEEPEINLHPQAQREFIKGLKESSSEVESQIIFTTHSSIIVDQLEHEEIVLFRKVEDNIRGFKTIVNQIPNNFFERYNLQEQQYYKFYRYKNSDFFFSDFVIIVESSIDAEVIKLLMKKENMDLDLTGISIIELGGVKSLDYPVYLLSNLSIPKLIIIDKDFFVPYLNDSLDASRDSNGFPRYRYQYKNESLSLINYMIPKESKRDQLLNLLKTNHSSALNLLEEYNLISMRYCLDMDLISSQEATKQFYDILNLQLTGDNSVDRKFLMTERKKAVKKIHYILEVIDRLPHRNLPNSYKRIKKVIGNAIKGIERA